YPLRGRGHTAVIMVIDELLVGAAAANDPQVRARLTALGAFDTGGTVFRGLVPSPSEDVHIWRLRRAPGNKKYPEVASVVWSVRRLLRQERIPRQQVAPNHVLVPSMWHTCPDGPPEEPGSPPGTLLPGQPSVKVVVIDAGYLENSPIAARIHQVDY